MSMSFPPNPKTSAIVGAVSVATVSFLASLVIVLMIVLKKKGERLSTPYRRIIFGISVSDMIQSFALLSGPFLIPSWTENSFGLGNNVTCAMDGFFLSIGSTAVPLETALLSFYYLCKLKFRLTNETFAWRFEFICHAFIILFVLIKASVSVGIGIIGVNPINSFCFYIYQPNGCQFVPEVVGECEPRRKIYSDILFAMQFAFEPIIFLVLALVFTGMLYCHAISWSKTIPKDSMLDSKHRVSTNISRRKDTDSMQDGPSGEISSECNDSACEERVQRVAAGEESLAHQLQNEKLHSSSNNDMRENSTKSCTIHQKKTISSNESFAENDIVSLHHTHTSTSTPNTSARLGSQNRVHHLSNLYTAETKTQAACYVGVFLITYLPLTLGYIFGSLKMFSSYSIIRSVFTLIYPLGGFFNMLVYTRPHVASVRRKYQGRISRIHAFFLVVMAGGEVPNNISSVGTASDDHVILQHQANKSYLEIDTPFGVEGKQKSAHNVSSFAVGSLDAVDGLSQSMEDDNVAYNPIGNWDRANMGHSGGENSQMHDISYKGSSQMEGQSGSSTESIWAVAYRRATDYATYLSEEKSR